MVLASDRTIDTDAPPLNRAARLAGMLAVLSPTAPRLTSQCEGVGNRMSLSATIRGKADFMNSYSYDALSRLYDVIQQSQPGVNAVAPKQVYYKLDGVGDVTEIDRSTSVTVGPNPNGFANSALTYKSNTGQLAGINHESGTTSLDDLTYTYDGVGRVATFTPIDGTATYGYDPMSQLISATYTTAAGGHQPANESYSFDTNGNRTADGSTATTAGTGNLLASDGTFDFAYDGNGNMVSRTRISDAPANDYLTTYTWDTGNRLTDVQMLNNAGTLTEHVHYAYDVFGRLIERDLDPTGGGTYTQVAHYVWDDAGQPASGVGGSTGGIVLAFGASDDLTDRYLNGPNTNAFDQYYTTLAEEDVTTPTQQGTVSWDLLDNQASVRDVANSGGTLVDHISYNSTGVTAYEQDSSTPRLLGWQGGVTDAVTGQEGLRWYDLADAVWSQPDPIGFLSGSMNLTESRGNDPINAVDPSGLKVIHQGGTQADKDTFDRRLAELAQQNNIVGCLARRVLQRGFTLTVVWGPAENPSVYRNKGERQTMHLPSGSASMLGTVPPDAVELNGVSSDATARIVIAHELGHAVLGLRDPTDPKAAACGNVTLIENVQRDLENARRRMRYNNQPVPSEEAVQIGDRKKVAKALRTFPKAPGAAPDANRPAPDLDLPQIEMPSLIQPTTRDPWEDTLPDLPLPPPLREIPE